MAVARCAPAAAVKAGASAQRRAFRASSLPFAHRHVGSSGAQAAAQQRAPRRLARDRPSLRRLVVRADGANGSNNGSDVENVVIIGSGPAGCECCRMVAAAGGVPPPAVLL